MNKSEKIYPTNTIGGHTPPASFLLTDMLRKSIIENQAIPDRIIVSPELFANAFITGELQCIHDNDGKRVHTFRGVIIEM